MTVREVVLHRDIRAFADFSPTTLLNRHHLRRFLSVFVLVGIDVAAIALAALLMVALTRTIRPVHPYPGVLTLTGVCLVVVFVFLINGLYGRRFMRQSARRLARASLMALAVVAMAALVLGFLARPSRGGAHHRPGCRSDLRRPRRLRLVARPRLWRQRPATGCARRPAGLL